MLVYHDASNDSDRRVAYPQYFDGFVDLGFVQIGRALAKPSGSLTKFAKSMGGDWRRCREHLLMPTPILCSPGSEAFVEISWFFDSPSIRIRTEFADGFLVETLRRWDYTPWNNPDADIDRLMMKNHAPTLDRSTRVVTSSVCSELWAAHVDHLTAIQAERGAPPVEHDDFEKILGVIKRTYERDSAYAHETAMQLPVGANEPQSQIPTAKAVVAPKLSLSLVSTAIGRTGGYFLFAAILLIVAALIAFT